MLFCVQKKTSTGWSQVYVKTHDGFDVMAIFESVHEADQWRSKQPGFDNLRKYRIMPFQVVEEEEAAA